MRLVLMGVDSLSIVISCISIILLIGFDQWTKMLAVSALQHGSSIQIIPGLLEFTYVENYGAAFGMLQNKTLFFLILTGICILAFIFILFAYKKHTWFTYLICVLIISGGIGNFIDRAMHVYVIDFIHVSFFPPVFNVADCCAVVGTILLCIYILFAIENKEKNRLKGSSDHE